MLLEEKKRGEIANQLIAFRNKNNLFSEVSVWLFKLTGMEVLNACLL